jgi:hypothetical protein
MMATLRELEEERAVRGTFDILPRAVRGCIRGYDTRCLECGWGSKAWDYRANALSVGYAHAFALHRRCTVRGEAALRSFGFRTVGTTPLHIYATLFGEGANAMSSYRDTMLRVLEDVQDKHRVKVAA